MVTVVRYELVPMSQASSKISELSPLVQKVRLVLLGLICPG